MAISDQYPKKSRPFRNTLRNCHLAQPSEIWDYLGEMQKGLNSDIQVRGKSYHIQTEDWGPSNPFLVSRVFVSGAVLKTIKTSYQEALNQESVRSEDAVRSALRKQHHRILDDLMSGQLS